MKQYKKPLMKIVELEKVDVLTTSCPGCTNKNWNGPDHGVTDGCDVDCTAHISSTESTAE